MTAYDVVPFIVGALCLLVGLPLQRRDKRSSDPRRWKVGAILVGFSIGLLVSSAIFTWWPS